MKTEEQLITQFGTVHPKLIDVAKYYLSMDEATAKKKAAKGLIPFKIFKAVDSNKAPWITHVSDLASYLDERRRSS